MTGCQPFEYYIGYLEWVNHLRGVLGLELKKKSAMPTISNSEAEKQYNGV